jgi:hypothetical protein
MFLLYRACTNELSKNIKVAAAAQGADVDFNEDWYDQSSAPQKRAMQPHDIAQLAGMGLSLGYETNK